MQGDWNRKSRHVGTCCIPQNSLMKGQWGSMGLLRGRVEGVHRKPINLHLGSHPWVMSPPRRHVASSRDTTVGHKGRVGC